MSCLGINTNDARPQRRQATQTEGRLFADAFSSSLGRLRVRLHGTHPPHTLSRLSSFIAVQLAFSHVRQPNLSGRTERLEAPEARGCITRSSLALAAYVHVRIVHIARL